MMKTPGMGEEPWIKDVRTFLSRGSGVLIRLRGLPYECTALQVVEFFRHGKHPSEVMDGEDGVYFVRKPDGKATGDAFVIFRTEAEASAALTRHKDLIGSRYIELFRMAPMDMEQTVRRTLEVKSRQTVLSSRMAQMPPPSQPAMPLGVAKDYIRLRGLPYEAQVQHILDFLGVLSKNIAPQGVHMVYSQSGQPTGEVFVQMDSEASAARAVAQCHNGIMAFGKKHRYVEVFQCSGQDMVAFLSETTPMPSPGLGEVVPTYFPVYPPPRLEPLHPPGPIGPPPGPFLYVVVANQQDSIFHSPPLPEWVAEYPVTPPISFHHPDYFVS